MSYCTAADVASLLRLIRENPTTFVMERVTFSTTTDPTLAEVEAWIAEAEDEIDRITRTAFEIRSTTEVHSVRIPYRNDGGSRSILLSRSPVQEFGTTEGDKLERWNGTEWEDISDDDGWWLDTRGIIHMESRWLPTYHSPYRGAPRTTKYRVTYRYGMEDVPGDIKRACAMLTGMRIIESDSYRKVLPTGTDGMGASTLLTRYDEQVKDILSRYREAMRVVSL